MLRRFLLVALAASLLAVSGGAVVSADDHPQSPSATQSKDGDDTTTADKPDSSSTSKDDADDETTTTDKTTTTDAGKTTNDTTGTKPNEVKPTLIADLIRRLQDQGNTLTSSELAKLTSLAKTLGDCTSGSPSATKAAKCWATALQGLSFLTFPDSGSGSTASKR